MQKRMMGIMKGPLCFVSFYCLLGNLPQLSLYSGLSQTERILRHLGDTYGHCASIVLGFAGASLDLSGQTVLENLSNSCTSHWIP